MKERGYQTIRISQFESIAKVSLHQPERRNPISALTVHELLWAFEDASQDPEVRVVVLTGAGGTFSSGGDLKQMPVGPDTVEAKGDFADLLLSFGKIEKPTIAQINGLAMGGALGLIAACDFAIASDQATFGTPEIKVGLFPMMIMAVLARVVPQRELMTMMLLGEKFEAEHARSIGLISEVVPNDELDSRVIGLARELGSRSPTAMRMGLAAFHRQRDLSLAEAAPMLQGELFKLIGTEDGQEGLRAFREKRDPVWKGR